MNEAADLFNRGLNLASSGKVWEGRSEMIEENAPEEAEYLADF
jgi:hypothetical protein